MKRFICLMTVLMLVNGMACAFAEEPDFPAGIWYLDHIVIDGDVYDVSLSSEVISVEFSVDHTGVLCNSSDGEQWSVCWTTDADGGTVFAGTDDRGVPMMNMYPEGEFLVIDGGETAYFLSRTSRERAEFPYGMIAVFSCEVPEQSEADPVENAISVIRQRLEKKGIGEAVIRRCEPDSIYIGIPDVQDESLPDLISAPGKLKFIGPDGELIMTGEQIKNAEYYYLEGSHLVSFELTDTGRELFADVTAKNIGRNIRILLDDEVPVDAMVNAPITEGSGVIGGSYTQEKAVNIAAEMKSGPLPLKLTPEKTEMVTDSAHAEKTAGARAAEKEDAAAVVLKMGDTEITKAQVEEATQNELAELYQIYAIYYGYQLDISDPEIVASAQNSAISALKQDMVLRAKAAELGLDQLTEAETARAQEAAENDLETTKSYIRKYILTDEQKALEGDRLEAVIQKQLDRYGVSLETYVTSERDTIIDQKVYDYAVKDVAVSEEEIRADYDGKVAADMEKYRDDAPAWTEANLNGTTLYYTPAGIRRVKHILLKYREEDQREIDSLRNRISESNSRISDAQKILDNEGISEEEKTKARANLDEARADLEAAVAAWQAAMDAGFAGLDAEADAILEALNENPDRWEELLAEKGEDPGMMEGAASAEKGYAVCEGMTRFDPAFVNAAMALGSVGDVSDKTRGESYGYYIIKYVGDETEGPADYDSVKSALHEALFLQKQEEVYSETVRQWIEEAEIIENLDAMNH